MYCLFFFLYFTNENIYFPLRGKMFSVFHKINKNPYRSIESCQQMRCVGHILCIKVRLIFVMVFCSPVATYPLRPLDGLVLTHLGLQQLPQIGNPLEAVAEYEHCNIEKHQGM